MNNPNVRQANHKIDVLAVFDGYEFYKNSSTCHDVDLEVMSLIGLANSHGHNNVYYFIAHEDDKERITAYRQNGHQLRPMNGNRPEELINVVTELVSVVDQKKPEKVIVMSNDPAFNLFCMAAERNDAEVNVWAPSQEQKLAQGLRHYKHWTLNELAPALEARVKLCLAFLDIENHAITMSKAGVIFETTAYAQVLNDVAAKLGVTLKNQQAWADWGKLRQTMGRDYQVEFEKNGVKTYYQINLPGKSTSDMALVGALHESLERDSDVSWYLLGSGDADYIPAVEAIHARGKKVAVIAMRNSLGRKLEAMADKVFYLDDYLPANRTRVTPPHSQAAPAPVTAGHAITACLAVANLLRTRRWQFAYYNRLPAWLPREWVAEAKDANLLMPRNPGDTDTVMLNMEHPATRRAVNVEKCVTGKLTYYFTKRDPMKYVDTALLARKTQEEPSCQEDGVPLSRSAIVDLLDAMAAARILTKEPMPHPNDNTHIINTWRLALMEGSGTLDAQPSEPKQPSEPEAGSPDAGTQGPSVQEAAPQGAGTQGEVSKPQDPKAPTTAF